MDSTILRHPVAALALATVMGSGSAYAGPIIGGATLIDNAAVHAGTVSYVNTLSYVSGGNGATGTADGTTWVNTAEGAAAALASVDHHWAQYDPALVLWNATAVNSVLAIPSIDHGWTSDNTGEFWEPFEFRIFGCADQTCAVNEAGVITDVYVRGVDDVGPMRNADDWTTRWGFQNSWNYFAVVSGDRLLGGPYSLGEGEIDALAVPVPEPATLALLGLGLVGLARERRRRS